MYPKVKVRTEESGEDDQHASHEHNWSSLLSLKDIQFLLLQDPRFPVKEYRDVSPLPVARIPRSYVPNVVLPTELPSEEPDNKSNSTEDEDKPKFRASSVLRPRAVISSPDNDALVANKNKVKALKPSALKRPNMIQSRHQLCKVAPSQATDGWNTTKCTDTTDKIHKKIDLKREKVPATALSSHKRNITKTKPSFVTN